MSQRARLHGTRHLEASAWVRALLGALCGGFLLVACDDDPEETACGPDDGMDAGAAIVSDAGSSDPGAEPNPSSPAPPPLVFQEDYRLQVHYSPPFGWMNDPNGLVFTDSNGLWHLFYQNNPLGNDFGSISWGHAVGDDLTRWQPVGVAIPFGERELIFSGSAVVDRANTSGLCDPEVAARGDCVIAIYTGNVETDTGFDQVQNLAISEDGGFDFRLFEGNPVLDVEEADFRDPKVFFHEPTQRWVMVITLPVQRRVAIYGSPNLIEWELLSDFGPAAAVGGVWECPDLIELPVPDAPGETVWVMPISVNPGHVTGGSGMQYFVGEFDGERFVPIGPTEEPRWVDWGPDFYCATTWSNDPEGERRWIAWMNDWLYASDLPTFPWRGQMSLPRRLALVQRGEALALAQQPEPSIERLRQTPLEASGSAAEITDAVPEDAPDTWELRLEVQGPAEAATELRFTQEGADPYALLRLPGDGTVVLERPPEANAEVNEAFADLSPFGAPLPASDGPLELRVFVDRSSIEVFTADGTVVLTTLVYPLGETTGFELAAPEDVTFDATLWPLRSIWR